MELNHFCLIIVLLHGVVSQSEPSVQNALNALPTSLQGKVDEKQVEDIKNKTEVIFKEKCEKNGGADAFSAVERAIKDFPMCLQSLVNVTALQDEVNVAKLNGTVDEVFKKYCEKTPDFKKCVSDVLDIAKPCFSPKERKNIKTVHNVTEQLAEFICFKGGDRIALFIAEGGPNCMTEKQEEIQSCFNTTLGKEYKNVDINNLNSIDMDQIPELEFGEHECRKMAELQKCMVSVLETCTQPTTANIVDSLIKFIRSATPCKDFPIPSDPNDPGAASGLSVTSLLLVITTAAIIFS